MKFFKQKPIKYLENILDKYTMYQVIGACLLGLNAIAFLFSLANLLSFSAINYLINLVVIFSSGWLTHYICQKLFKSHDGLESTVISLLIIGLIVYPDISLGNLFFVSFISFFAITSKYVIIHRDRHVFNPVALALFVAGLLGYLGAEWWIANRLMIFFTLVVGALVLIKIRRLKIALLFVITSTIFNLIYLLTVSTSPVSFADILKNLTLLYLSYPLVFFVSFMFTEPNAFPSTYKKQLFYGGLVSFLFSVPYNIGHVVYGTPELALLIGNLFTRVVDKNAKYILTLKEKIFHNNNIVEYIFKSDKPVNFIEGQYMEWVLPHSHADSRGIKRTFSLVTATDNNHQVGFAVKHLANGSSYKKALLNLSINEKIYASGVAGDFTNVKTEKFHKVYLAGGIGITPFISMLRKAIIKKQPINASLINCLNNRSDYAWSDTINQAKKLGLTVFTVYSDANEKIDSANNEFSGYINQVILSRAQKSPTDFFYVSGPALFVEKSKELLSSMGIKNNKIITDYFSGL